MKNISLLSILIVLLSLSSCNGDESTKQDQENVLVLSISKNKVLRNQEIALQLYNGEIDITQNAIFFVNDVAIEGNNFSSENEGIFDVFAKYTLNGITVESQKESFEVYIPRKKALVEGFTGTWCGWCPPIKTGFENARNSIDDLVLVSLHVNSSVTQDQDPFSIPEGKDLFNFFEVRGVPWGFIDRNLRWTYETIDNLFPVEDIEPFAGFDTDISIGLDSELINNELSINLKVISEVDILNTKLVVFLLEDGLIYDQVNYYNSNYPGNPFYGMGNPLVDFEHNDVLRMSITNPLGESIPEISELTEYDVSFNVNIPSEYNPSKLKLVATLLDENNLVRNTQQAPINQFQDFE